MPETTARPAEHFKSEARRVLATMPALRTTNPKGWEQNRRYVRRMLAEAQRRTGRPS